MAEPFVFKVNNPPETGQSIAQKLNQTVESVDVSVIKGAVSRNELSNLLSSTKAQLDSKVEDSYKKTFTHIEATYARSNSGTKKMSDPRFHGGGTPITVSDTAPSNPKYGDLWFDIS